MWSIQKYYLTPNWCWLPAMERATKVLQARNLSAYLHVDVVLLRHNFNWDKDLMHIWLASKQDFYSGQDKHVETILHTNFLINHFSNVFMNSGHVWPELTHWSHFVFNHSNQSQILKKNENLEKGKNHTKIKVLWFWKSIRLQLSKMPWKYY